MADQQRPVSGDPVSLDGPIEKKIAWAESCRQKAGGRLLADPAVADLLVRFEAAACASSRKMREAGVEAFCRDCDLHEGGSCCGRGIELRYTGSLLLINRLLNRPLPAKRFDPGGCFFLGPDGCVLTARHVICINYLCEKITRSIAPETLAPLRECEGEEIQTLFLLEERVKQVLHLEHL